MITDPVAVMGVLKEAKLPKSLETQVAGESLFNDGVGYVVYLILVSLAFPVLAGGGHGEADAAGVGSLFLREAGGGAGLSALAVVLLVPGSGPWPLLWIMLATAIGAIVAIQMVIWRAARLAGLDSA